MKITVIGTGYVGLVSAVSLSLLGHDVISVGRNRDKIEAINSGGPPFYEPGLTDALRIVLNKKKFSATDDLTTSVLGSEVTLIAVGTPTRNGSIDLSQIETVSRDIGAILKRRDDYHVVVVKSTVIPGTTDTLVRSLLEHYSGKRAGKDFGLCMNPEFLREGKALEDALTPDRIIIGSLDRKGGQTYGRAYRNLDCPVLHTTLRTAEMTKYASNALLSTLISFSNEIARICEKTGDIDAVDVWKGLHLDGRLSPTVHGKRIFPGIVHYIQSGCGYGGSCFPKDTHALSAYAKAMKLETPVLDGVIRINGTQPERVVRMLTDAVGTLRGKKIALLGLTFKPDTDDLRESPSIRVLQQLLKAGARVSCHDPEAYKHGIPEMLTAYRAVYEKNYASALRNADAMVIMTAWREYRRITPQILKRLMKQPVLVDGRRMFDKAVFFKEGCIYKGIGLS
ncbi:UDP-glucose/GDP-mannose dehydrogenase family protein [Patescibacteria group bacterium]|nr:UDP-glucose/GDP-mannose dehydrogenase family protein [Patescibacteria group bacterium]